MALLAIHCFIPSRLGDNNTNNSMMFLMLFINYDPSYRIICAQIRIKRDGPGPRGSGCVDQRM